MSESDAKNRLESLVNGPTECGAAEAPLEEAGVRAGFRAALEAAADKMGATAPNPAVGCTLLDAHGEILAVGAHPGAGQPHAEAAALDEAARKGVLERVRTALVTLEPCNHQGRTPPCSERLRASPVRTVWIGARDPNPQAAGGAERLAEADNEDSGHKGSGRGRCVRFLADYPDYADLEADCAALLAPFASRVLRGRPWLTVKQALTPEGGMVPPPGRKTFTSPDSLILAHRLRRATDAVVTGIGTVLADSPSFTVRRVPDHFSVGSSAGNSDGISERIGNKRRLLLVFDRQGRLPEPWRRAREADGFDVAVCTNGAEMIALLAAHDVNWALVEAGPALLKTLVAENLWDDWLTIHQAPPRETSAPRDRLALRVRETGRWGVSPVRFLENIVLENRENLAPAQNAAKGDGLHVFGNH